MKKSSLRGDKKIRVQEEINYQSSFYFEIHAFDILRINKRADFVRNFIFNHRHWLTESVDTDLELLHSSL